MKYIVLKSDYRDGINGARKWSVLYTAESLDLCQHHLMQCAKECSFDIVIDRHGNAYDEELEETVYYKSHLEFNYLTYWFNIVSQDEFDKGVFDGKQYGFASDEIKKYFGLDPAEIVKTYHLNWGDGWYIGTDLKELISDVEGSIFNEPGVAAEELEIQLLVKKVMTRRQVEELPEFDL